MPTSDELDDNKTGDVSMSLEPANGHSSHELSRDPEQTKKPAQQKEHTEGNGVAMDSSTSQILAQPASSPQEKELEARLTCIEDRLADLEYDGDPYGSERGVLSDAARTTPAKRRDQLCSSQLKYMSVKEFDSRKFSLWNDHNAIDVVTSSGEQQAGFFANDPELSSGDTNDRAYKNFDQLILIQINSLALLNTMKSTYSGLRKSWVDKSFVILAPFKSLYYEEERLRETLAKLEAKWSTNPNASDNGSIPGKTVAVVTAEGSAQDLMTGAATTDLGTGTQQGAEHGVVNGVSDGTGPLDAKSEEDPDTGPESLTAYKDLTLLMDFYDTRVKPWWTFLRGSQAESVKFGDLCAFYSPNDYVTMPDYPQRTFRILSVVGGRPKLEQLCKGVSAPASEESQDTDREASKSGGPETDRNNWTSLILDCFYIDYNGTEFVAVMKKWTIRPFMGAKDVKRLRPYPLRYAPSKLKDECRAEGMRFLDVTDPKKRPALYRYQGRTLTQRPDGVKLCRSGKTFDVDYTPASDYLSQEDVDAQVIVDFDATFLYNPGWAPDVVDMTAISTGNIEEDDVAGLPSTSPLERDSIVVECFHLHDTTRYKRYLEGNAWVMEVEMDEDDDEVDKEGRSRFQSSDGSFKDDVLLLPNRVVGYVLRTRTWLCFDLSTKAHWRPVTKDDQSWKELQIVTSHRRTLASLVERHFRNRRAVRTAKTGERVDNFDFIEGKGKGLIVLLHGAPGVGKTSTAESIASLYGKPLLPITCGNLGTDARMVEQSLQENFRLAESWGCIVLLDEADVFLARREKNDLQRNALVSVFLRMLEYYTGILFLTTNRTGDFDEAFRSRIHVSLYYSDLDRARTLRVWEINLDRVVRQASGKGYVVTQEGRKKIMQFAGRHWTAYGILQRSPWNGRQIRNAFQTAVALAEYSEDDNRREVDANRPPAELTWEHFKKVAAATNQFEAYLIETRGKTEAEQADEYFLRAKLSVYGTETDEESAGREPQKWKKVSNSKAAEFIESLHPDHDVVEPEGLDEAPVTNPDPFMDAARSAQRHHSFTRASHHFASPAHTPGPQGTFAAPPGQLYDTRIPANGIQMGAPMYSVPAHMIPSGYVPAGQVPNPAYYQQSQPPTMLAGQLQNHYTTSVHQQPDQSQQGQPQQTQPQFQQGQAQVSTNSGQTLPPMSASPLAQHAQQQGLNAQNQQMQQGLYGQPMYPPANQLMT